MPKAAIPVKDGELPAKNRPRTSTACLNCRKKRAKCDGEKPACAACSLSGATCEYDMAGDKRKPYNKSVVQAMQLRIESLERENAQLRDAAKQQGQSPGFIVASTSGSPSEGPPPTLVPTAGAGDFPKNVSMDAFQGGLARNIHGELRYFGPTSSFRSVLADSTGDTTAPSSPSVARLEAARTFSLTRAPLPAAVPSEPTLPRRPPDLTPEFQSKLMKLAFEFCFSQYNMVPEREFYHDLQHHPYERTDHYSPLLGNLVLAIGARYLDPNEDFPPEICGIEGDPETRGDVWVAYSRYLLDQEWYNPKLSTIKGLLVLAMYMACRGFDGPCSMFNGLALRLIEDFGMHFGIHRLAIGHGHVDPALNHARLHTFYAAFQADVIASIYIGRRITFTPDEIDIGLPVVVPELDYDPPMYRSSAFLWFSKLCLIGAKIMDKIYSLKPIALADRQAAVPELHLALENWYHELPSYLRANMSDPAKAPHPHIIALNAAYHMMHIQLHRPFFRRASKDMPLSVSTDKCLAAAQNLVRIVKLLRGTCSLRFSGPGVQHAVFCGGTILALSAVEDGISETPQQDAARRAAAKQDLNLIVEALKEMGITWTTAQTVAAILEAFATQWNSELPTVEQIQDENWQPQWTENSATASFSYIFPSFDLDPTNQLDFMSLLNPLPSSVAATPETHTPNATLSPFAQPA